MITRVWPEPHGGFIGVEQCIGANLRPERAIFAEYADITFCPSTKLNFKLMCASQLLAAERTACLNSGVPLRKAIRNVWPGVHSLEGLFRAHIIVVLRFRFECLRALC